MGDEVVVSDTTMGVVAEVTITRCAYETAHRFDFMDGCVPVCRYAMD